MGPRLKVDNATFLDQVTRSSGKVIRGPKVIFQGATYLVRGEDYYYYTMARKELPLPQGVEVMRVAQILL